MATKIADGPKARYARVKIEYNKDKPKISFSYPTKDGRTGDMLGVIINYWQYSCLGLLALFVVCFLIYSSITGIEVITISNLDLGNVSTIEKFTMCAINHSAETIVNYSNVRFDICKPEGVELLSRDIYGPIAWFAFGAFLFFSLPPFIIYYPFRKKWNKLFPAYAAWIAEKKIAYFKPTDVQMNLLKHDKYHSYFVELPVFENIICDFKCRGEFSDYLKEVEIREHNFKYYKAAKKGKMRKRVAHQSNELLWYARFYFSDKPKSGSLSVIFK